MGGRRMPESKDDIERADDSDDARSRNEPMQKRFAGISHDSWIKLPLVIVLLGIAWYGGSFTKGVENASTLSQQQMNTITTANATLTGEFKELRTKVEDIAKNAITPKDVELAVREVLSTEVARLWERVGQIDERTRTTSGRASDPPPK